MNFGFTEEQNLLREQVARFMQAACPTTRVRQIMAREDGFDADLWAQAAKLGWLGLITPETQGGIGLKWIDLTVVLEETARGLCPLPITSQALASAAILRCGSTQQQSQWLPMMAAGTAICTLGLYDEANWIAPEAVTLTGTRTANGVRVTGSKPFVCDAMAASHYLLAIRVADELKLAALSRDQVQVTAQPTMDRTKPMGRISLDGVEISDDHLLSLSTADLAWLTDLGAVAVTAEMIGAAEAALKMTSDYARERIQFGKPIGQYQGVKHRLADCFVDVESFKSLLYYAAWCADDAPEQLPRAISLAKGYASDAFVRIGIDGVGLHGAIGFTAEYDVQLYLKRSKWARPMYGDSDHHLDRAAALGGL
ncbi:MAG: acyl-CoA dehydrogenase family protein [Pseudomonadales bacterium]|nr:acyl-CoA/acyl-ACP dehydrogenase [Pseudomonadales bacterium]